MYVQCFGLEKSSSASTNQIPNSYKHLFYGRLFLPSYSSTVYQYTCKTSYCVLPSNEKPLPLNLIQLNGKYGMKKLLILPVFLVGALPGFSQCDKPVKLSVSKTEYLDRDGAVQRTVDENSTIDINATEVVIIPGGDPDKKMTGKIQSKTCTWSVPYKEGKSVVKATVADPSGDQKNATMTIEGKEGKLTFLMEVAEMPDRKIRVSVDKFEEKKQ